MNQINIWNWLKRLSPTEVKHKQFPERQMLTYQKRSHYLNKNGELVYQFRFAELIDTVNKSAVPLSNHLTKDITLVMVQHTRYSIVPLHIHDYIEINYVVHGSVTELIEGHKYLLKTGSLSIIDTKTVHTLLETNEDDIILNILIKKEYFTSDFLNQIPYDNELSKFIIHCISTVDTQAGFLIVNNALSLRSLLLNILTEQLQNQSGYTHIMEAYLKVFFIQLTREEDYAVHSEADLAGSLQTYIETNFRTITLEKAANHFSFHPNYFSRLVHKKTGKTFKRLVQNKRITTAASYLNNTNWSVSQIINEVGISNHAFFYQKFKEQYRMSPKQYRLQFKDNQK